MKHWILIACLAAAGLQAQTPQYLPAKGATSVGSGVNNKVSFPGMIAAGGKVLGSPVNVQQYGVKCDGVTDDTAALTTALNSEPSLIFPPGATCLVSTYILLNNAAHAIPTGGNAVVDLNGATILFTGDGDTTVTRANSTRYELWTTFIDSNGFIQVVTTAGTTAGSAPSFSSTYAQTTADGTAVVTNFGIAPYHWVPSVTWYVGQKISSGGFMYRVEVQGLSAPTLPTLTATPGNTTQDGNSLSGWPTSSAVNLGDTIIDPNGNLQKVTTAGTTGGTIPASWAKVPGGTTADGSAIWQVQGAALVWRNIGPPPTTKGCGNAYNGLLRIATPHWIFKNGTLEASNAGGTCLVNNSVEAANAFNFQIKFHNMNWKQDPVAAGTLTNMDGIYTVNQNQLEVQGGTFSGALGRHIVCGDWAQTAGGNYCDRAVITNNNHFARGLSNYPKAQYSTAVTVGDIYTTNAPTSTSSSAAGYVVLVTVSGTTGASAPTWPTIVGNTVVWGTATLKLIQVPSNYDPTIWGFFTGAGAIDKSNFEWGPAVNVNSKLTDDVMNFSGNLMTDGTPDYWAQFNNTTVTTDTNEAYFITPGFGTGIVATTANNCTLKGNAVFNALVGIYAHPTAAVNSCTVESNTVKGIPTVLATATNITAYSGSSGTLTLTATNTYTAGTLVKIAAGGGDALTSLNGLYFSVLSAGLSSSQFAITNALGGAGASTATASAVLGAGIQVLGGKAKVAQNVVIMANSSETAIQLGGGGNTAGPNSITGKYDCAAQNNFITADPANLGTTCATATNTISNLTSGVLNPPNLGSMSAFCTGSIGTASGTFYILAPATNTTACNSTTLSEPNMPVSCTARNMYVKLGSSATTGVTVTMYKNGGPAALTVSLGAGVASLPDLTHTVAFALGDTWSVRAAPGQATESVANIKVSFQCY